MFPRSKQYKPFLDISYRSNMKYYETAFEEYIQASNQYNMHPELDHVLKGMPVSIDQFQNMILYGPSGSGKYTQALKLIEKYSPSRLKYDRKISVSNDKIEKKKQIVVETTTRGSGSGSGSGSTTISGTLPSSSSLGSMVSATNAKKKTTVHSSITQSVPKKEISMSKKQEFTYRISDIHYEVDMSLLGCNSKTLWHDIFFQIVDIISVKQHKVGIIVCKNFDVIYNELLDIFYSYMKHPLDHTNTHIYFILLTENISFIPNNILSSCCLIPVIRPMKDTYLSMLKNQRKEFFYQMNVSNPNKLVALLKEIDETTIVNTKELFMLKKLDGIEDLPPDIDFTICDNLLSHIYHPDQIKLSEFRNMIYDLLVYNVNIPECMYYIIQQCVLQNYLDKEELLEILKFSYTFLKYYNNNYRSIYHLESMIFFIINKIHFKGRIDVTTS